jgi:hypothetical protein
MSSDSDITTQNMSCQANKGIFGDKIYHYTITSEESPEINRLRK